MEMDAQEGRQEWGGEGRVPQRGGGKRTHRLRLEANPGFRVLLAGDYPKYILLYSILLLKKKQQKNNKGPLLPNGITFQLYKTWMASVMEQSNE